MYQFHFLKLSKKSLNDCVEVRDDQKVYLSFDTTFNQNLIMGQFYLRLDNVDDVLGLCGLLLRASSLIFKLALLML